MTGGALGPSMKDIYADKNALEGFGAGQAILGDLNKSLDKSFNLRNLGIKEGLGPNLGATTGAQAGFKQGQLLDEQKYKQEEQAKSDQYSEKLRGLFANALEKIFKQPSDPTNLKVM